MRSVSYKYNIAARCIGTELLNRVAREVGTEGKLGGQARVANVGGTWKDLTDNVNVMANNVSFINAPRICSSSRYSTLANTSSAKYRCCNGR